MKLVYCSDPLNPCQPDEAYRAEVAAAERLGVPLECWSGWTPTTPEQGAPV